MAAPHLFSNPLRHSRPGDTVRRADPELMFSELPRRGGVFRGLLIAVALAVPFWVALYLLLR